MSRYYTPKEYKEAFGEPWGERDAVYFVDYADCNTQRFWSVGTLEEIKEYADSLDNGEILCATTHCPADDYFHEVKGGENVT
jgi:hypothetical protein